MIIPPEGLAHTPPGIRDILILVGNSASAVYVHEPLPAGQDRIGQDRIEILLDNLRSSTIDPRLSQTFEDIVISWFSGLLLGGSQATDETGVDNRIFQAVLTP